MNTHSTLVVLAALVLTGCGDKSSKVPPPAAIASAPQAEKKPKDACEMVTQAEMSAIVGGEVIAKSVPHVGKTECIYTSTKEVGPYVELSVEWGSGQAAMMGTSMLNSYEPGIANAYEGLGDQAVDIGSALWIRTGDDLVSIVWSGIEDMPTAAKKIFNTAKARM